MSRILAACLFASLAACGPEFPAAATPINSDSGALAVDAGDPRGGPVMDAGASCDTAWSATLCTAAIATVNTCCEETWAYFMPPVQGRWCARLGGAAGCMQTAAKSCGELLDGGVCGLDP